MPIFNDHTGNVGFFFMCMAGKTIIDDRNYIAELTSLDFF